MTFTMDIVQLVIVVASMVGSIALNTWAIVRYLIGRIDAQGSDFHARISTLREGVVMRKEYDRDMQRLHTEVAAVRSAVTLHGNSHTARIDALIIALGGKNNT